MKMSFFNLALSLSFLTFSEIFAQPSTQSIEAGGFLSGIDLTSSVGEKPTGFGVRLGYNVNNNLIFEGELSYYPENPDGNFGQTIFLAGMRAGIRHKRFGGFVKARPGIVYFGGSFFKAFNGSSHRNFAMDLGIVLEYYSSRHVVVRIETGDTIIPFGDKAVKGPMPPYTIQPGITHNRQSSIGIGFSFGSGSDSERP